MASKATLLRLEAPHFVAGVALRGKRVVNAAPIVRYMVGWDHAAVLAYAQEKRWAVTVVSDCPA